MDQASFYAAIRAGSEGIVRESVEAQPKRLCSVWDPAVHGNDWDAGATPLHVAVRHGQRALVELFLEAGAPIDARTAENRTPLHDSYEFGQESLTRLLIEHGAEYDICVAAARGDFGRVGELLSSAPELANDDSTGLSVLGWAGYGQDPAMVPFLVALGARLGDELCCPCGTGNVPILDALLDCGADPDAVSSGTRVRPLHVAATLRYSCDTSAVIERLLAAGADVNGAALDGKTTPLDVAHQSRARCAPDDQRRLAGFERVIELLTTRGGRRSDG